MNQTAESETPFGFLDRLSIRQQLVGAVVLILVLFSAACVVSLMAFENVRAARDVSDVVNAKLVLTAKLEEAVSRQESALRAYALTGAARASGTLDAMSAQFDRAMDRLIESTQGAPIQMRRLQNLEALEQRWRESVVDPIRAEVEAGNRGAAQRLLVAGAGTALIDPMRELAGEYRAKVQSDLDASIATLDFRQERARWTLLGMLLVGLWIGLITVRAVVRRVSQPLVALSQTTQRLANGERDVKIAFRRRGDEIGRAAAALEKFRKIILEQDRHAWIRDHRARITVMLQRCKSEEELGRRVLEELCPLLNAGYGALFTPADDDDEDSSFELIAGYGYATQVQRVFAPGEGLVGQVVATRKRLSLNDVPVDYLPVRSGLGEGSPPVLLLAPVEVGEHLVGVVELALMRELNETEVDLLESVLPNVALALMSLARTRRTAQLLEQSRAQATALQESSQQLRQRQDELKTANSELRMRSEELNAQSEELRASEEELKVQSDELQATNEELRQKQDLMRHQQEELAHLHAETERRAEALARANQYKSDFLANMSHELRTPLNSLLILARSLAENQSGHLDAEEAEAANIIHDSGRNLLTLINDILDLSKIEAGKMVVRPERAAIVQLVRRIERDFAHVAANKGLDFSVEIGDDVPESLYTDIGKLDQIVRNLVSNAIKFTERGAVRVVIERPDAGQRFETEELTPDNALAVRVSDQGIGIPKDRQEQIFQAFEQVDAGSSRNYGGTGLGLSISRQLARLLGGELSVASELGAGSRFTLFIRRELEGEAAVELDTEEVMTSAPAPGAGPPPGQMAPARERPHVLVIDDDTTFSGVVARAARERGFECTTVAEGERGLDMARQQLPDAIVLDLGLPGMDGWTVLDRLKANERTRHIPVHIVSAADDTGRYKQSGAIGFLRKPISREELNTLFVRAEALSGREARRVLVIDDDRDAHTAITQLLKHEGVSITAVVSGAEGLARLDAEDFDCVVLDLSLPDTSGFELIEKIDRRDEAPPVVVYSARELSEDETRRLRAHTDSIVIKGSRAQERLLDEISLFFHRLGDAPTRPHAAPAAPAETQSQAAADINLDGGCALLVDDDMRNTFALSRVLRGHGMTVLMASDGFKALSQLESNPQISVVLMDIMMPGMDGYETIRRIRAQPQYEALPIIALTAKAMPGDREKCIEAGANEYLPKPLDTDALIALLGRLL